MCGIAGALMASGTRANFERDVTAMADSIAYRGPDDHGDAAGGQHVSYFQKAREKALNA